MVTAGWAHYLLHSKSRMNRKWEVRLSHLQAHPWVFHFSQCSSTPQSFYNLPKTAPEAGCKVFKCVSLWGMFHIQNTIDSSAFFVTIHFPSGHLSQPASVGLPNPPHLTTNPSMEEAAPETAKWSAHTGRNEVPISLGGGIPTRKCFPAWLMKPLSQTPARVITSPLQRHVEEQRHPVRPHSGMGQFNIPSSFVGVPHCVFTWRTISARWSWGLLRPPESLCVRHTPPLNLYKVILKHWRGNAGHREKEIGDHSTLINPQWALSILIKQSEQWHSIKTRHKLM